jgi:protein-tyrosine phosphatase
MNDKKKILFVCLGNICRSPAAEGVMQAMIERSGVSATYFVDSAGTQGYHTGHLPDSRMREHASRRGYELTSRARRFDPERDWFAFDHILTMDESNYAFVEATRPRSADRPVATLQRMVDYCVTHAAPEVPDPYYGGADGFEEVLDMLEEGCARLLEELNGCSREK